MPNIQSKIFGNGNILANAITSKKRLFDIQDDPWNRDFKKIKDTFTVEEMGLLVYGFTQVEKKKLDCGVCMKKWDKVELVQKYPIRNFEFQENYVIGYGDAYWYA